MVIFNSTVGVQKYYTTIMNILFDKLKTKNLLKFLRG